MNERYLLDGARTRTVTDLSTASSGDRLHTWSPAAATTRPESPRIVSGRTT